MASACSIVLANEQSSIIGSTPSASLKTRASTCLLMTIAVVCVCILVVCGVFIVREYTLAKTYEPTNCRLANVTYTADVGCLYCSGTKDKTRDKSAGSCVNVLSPCVHINVLYQVNETLRRALLYQDSVQAIGAFSQCSYSVCMKSRDESLRQIEDYADVWRSKPTDFRCFYDTDYPDKVIATKTYSRLDVIHCMLWPSVVIVVCGVVFLRLEALRRGLTFCGKTPRPETDKKGPEEKWSPATKKAVKGATANNACNRRQHREPDAAAAACNLMQPVAANNACDNGKRAPAPPVNRNVERCCNGGRERTFTRLSSSMSSLEKSTAPKDDDDQGPWPLPAHSHPAPKSQAASSSASVTGKSSSIDRLKEDVRFISLKGEAQSTAMVGELL